MGRFEFCTSYKSAAIYDPNVYRAAYEFGDVLPFELALSTVAVFSPEPGEPLLRALFAADSALGGADDAALAEGAIAANWRGETCRSRLGASAVAAAGAAIAVDIGEVSSVWILTLSVQCM